MKCPRATEPSRPHQDFFRSARLPRAREPCRDPKTVWSSEFRVRQVERLRINRRAASYRYAWAERALTAGYPERFAMENLGHNSKAVHRAYAKRALVKIPSLEDYEERAAADT